MLQSSHLEDFLFLQEHILASVFVGLAPHRPQYTSSFSCCLPCFCFSDYLVFTLCVSLNISLGLSPPSSFYFPPSPLSTFLPVSLFPGPLGNACLPRQILESLNLTLDVEVLFLFLVPVAPWAPLHLPCNEDVPSQVVSKAHSAVRMGRLSSQLHSLFLPRFSLWSAGSWLGSLCRLETYICTRP